ncbi:helix-turn-helix transcriptional regulator [Desulfofustis glycolicus]|uniref:Predicted DNA-binding transcriptional regulator YafY, contains an HTH and WYL domains n=1 Tax=Desulfofustis glycolicus DSM 9705 TaxID=1121409 RepID=A0A1M5Y757_9BACT|nr:WYL domain-containing protein [Desulfofustis glycolicus]MCB2216870.1 WYL domain-containing protein [Desulfobulbaceae bacterium]SHI07806.1 Predicted DNA-binding transcriptional regulator YafY, contains an HTH and WYL domains [Desulfofustis glycolicus DSM 9705]
MSLLERIYFFHNELTRNRYPNARTLMREFEISQPTARRDIAYLRDRLLAPLTYDQRKNGFYYSDAAFNLPFENSARIVFLLGMLNKLATETGLGELPEIRQLEKRLTSMVATGGTPITDSIHCEWIEVEYPTPEVFDTIIEAIVKRRRLELTYSTLKHKQTERIVEPLKLINYQGRWYLAAWCTLREETRIFHLARIKKAAVGARAVHSASTADKDLDRSFGIFKGPLRYRAEILFTGEAAELVKNQYWHREQEIESSTDGIIMRLPVSDNREIMMKVLQYGAQAKVLGPLELRHRVETEIAKLTDSYRS